MNNDIAKVKFEHAEAALTDTDVRGLERDFGIRFPAPVLALYQRVNGGEPVNYIFDILETSISEFLPLTASAPEETATDCYKDLVLEQERRMEESGAEKLKVWPAFDFAGVQRVLMMNWKECDGRRNRQLV
jgi:hypothetical protein